MSRNGYNGTVAGSGSKASGARSGKRALGRPGSNAAGDGVNRTGKSGFMAQQSTIELPTETMDHERAASLVEKQAQLESVVDTHDNLVRELFHMENFTMMLSFDPIEAKADHTGVFKEYKSKFDLIDNAASVAGPSRKTRGRLNERRQIISSAAVSPPVSSPFVKRNPKPKITKKAEILETLASASAVKGKGRQGDVASEHDNAPVPDVIMHELVDSVSAPVIDLPKSKFKGIKNPEILEARGKRKRQEKTVVAGPNIMPQMSEVIMQEPDESISIPPVEDLPTITVIRRTPKRKAYSPLRPPIVEPTFETIRPIPALIADPEGLTSPLAVERPLQTNGKFRHAVLPPGTMDALRPSKNGINGHVPCPTNESVSVGLKRRSGRLKEPATQTSKTSKTSKNKLRLPGDDRVLHSEAPLIPSYTVSTPMSLPPVIPSPLKPTVKRIKLIVRRPPPTISNPRQRLPEPKYNSSLSNFLLSYINIDEEDVTLSALEEEAKEEAEIKERVEQFRREGRFIPETDIIFGNTAPDTPYTGPKRTSADIWDAVVDAVVVKGRTKQRKSLGRQVASQIASKVQAHFDGQELKRTKTKEVEERRLRNLAKATMKMVIGEWKKAVYHIREKQRMEEEAEERRLGHAHLDAILDQSGQLLETQQGDLSRGDMYGSRSRSGSIGDFDNQDDEEEEEGEEGEGTEREDDGQDVDEEEGDEEEFGMQALVNDPLDPDEDEEGRNEEGRESSPSTGDLYKQAPTPSRTTPTTTSSDYPEQEDNDVHTTQLLNGDFEYQAVDMQSELSFDETLEALVYPDPGTSPQHPQTSDSRLTAHYPDGGFAERTRSASVPLENHNRLSEAMDQSSKATTHNHLNVDYGSASPSPSPEVEAWAQEPEQVPTFDSMHEMQVDHSTAGTIPQMTGMNAMAQERQSDIEAGQENLHMADDDLDQNQQQVDPATLADLAKLPMADDIEREQGDSDAEDVHETEEMDTDSLIPDYLKPYAVAPVEWNTEDKVTPPLLLRGVLRPYQQSGLEWLASLHVNRLNGILADEMGLGKTIQTIALLAHLACDRGIWGPHLIVVPTSVLLNWEMEFKKFLPGFRVLSYHGTTKRRKELRQGWNDKHHFNVCITSYTLASKDAHIFKRKAWYYMILDEAHMIKNFKSQRWNILLMFRSYRRLLLTGTPLQNNLTELWALLQFLMSGSHFANLKEFGEWFSNPLEKAIEMGNVLDDETLQRVSKLHTVLRPYLLRRLKRDVEKELPSKFEHLTLCPLSKRQRFLYDEFMSRAHTRDALDSGVYQKIANILMQLRKVCNHPDLFEIRPIVTSFAMPRSAVADFEVKELLIRRQFLMQEEESVNLDVIGLSFIDTVNASFLATEMIRSLDATTSLPYYGKTAGEPPPKDTRTIAGFRKYSEYLQRVHVIARWTHIGYLNRLRCSRKPILSGDMLAIIRGIHKPITPFSPVDYRLDYLDTVDWVNKAVKSYTTRAQEMALLVDHFAFVTPPVVALDLPRIALSGYQDTILAQPLHFDELLHPASVKLQIAFPDPSLLQYDCGKMQKLASLLREKKAGGHRILIFTQMTRILDILEIFLNFHGYLYLRLDGATKIEDRQYITERFNADSRIFCFIASSRSGGVGINLTGADTVVFYDSDFNPQMDRQCEDRAHRIGQIRDVHIYRFISQYTVEEAMLRKANQKRSLDDLVIQKGEFDWRSLFNDEGALTKALGDFEDAEDRHAAAVAAREEFSLVGADEADFGGGEVEVGTNAPGASTPADVEMCQMNEDLGGGEEIGGDEDEDQGGSVVDYMLTFIEDDYDYFRDWRL